MHDIRDIKIIAALTIFIVGGFGCAAPVIARQQSRRNARVAHYLGFFQQCMMAVGAGVVISTALLHIIPDGMDALKAGGWGGGSGVPQCKQPPQDQTSNTSLSANSAASSHHYDHAHRAFAALAAAKHHRQNNKHSHSEDNADDVGSHAASTKKEAEEGQGQGHHHRRHHSTQSLLIQAASRDGSGYPLLKSTNHSGDGPDGGGDDDDDGYPYALLLVLIGLGLTFVAESELHRLASRTAGATMKAHLVEAGMAVHSVLIGVAFGTLSSLPTANTLAVALSFHQLCEGFAVGPIIARGANSIRHAALLVFIFAFSTPFGIAIGVLASAVGNPDSCGGQLTQGVLSLVAAGLLLYVGNVEFLGSLLHNELEHQSEEMQHEHHIRKRQRREQKALFVAALQAGRGPCPAALPHRETMPPDQHDHLHHNGSSGEESGAAPHAAAAVGVPYCHVDTPHRLREFARMHVDLVSPATVPEGGASHKDCTRCLVEGADVTTTRIETAYHCSGPSNVLVDDEDGGTRFSSSGRRGRSYTSPLLMPPHSPATPPMAPAATPVTVVPGSEIGKSRMKSFMDTWAGPRRLEKRIRQRQIEAVLGPDGSVGTTTTAGAADTCDYGTVAVTVGGAPQQQQRARVATAPSIQRRSDYYSLHLDPHQQALHAGGAEGSSFSSADGAMASSPDVDFTAAIIKSPRQVSADKAETSSCRSSACAALPPSVSRFSGAGGAAAVFHQEASVCDSSDEEEEDDEDMDAITNDFLSQHPLAARLATYGLFFFGAGAMAIIALWA